jgi:murein DD-endopeptidase MepM/ murein hydrolase activator NlpD
MPHPIAVVASLLLTVLAGQPTGWAWPTGSASDPPPVVTRFDPPAQPWLAGHRGVDLAAAPGTAVRAAGEGVVVFAGPLAGRGVVSIAHPGGIRTTYEPLLAEVATGTLVRRGHIIGTVDTWRTRHRSCTVSSCLHWGARVGDRYIDPLSLIAAPPVRLLAGPPVSAVTRSGAGVRLRVRPPQPLDRDVRVALGGRDRGVPEQLLNRPQVRAALE